ncbi:winged helix-turn-helix transcriptional regulator [Klenkia brasiliensis]|uniref:Transcriptional regulator, HxlR family n=1 Tax=Klenkia brasiliensis TaxID=333142 RepID=A0A1G8A9K9_9ACTN|nr:helix-turn-helix domain-containing protein [Klenkia brasiliensis]SDH17652.1 transcriptional regulator, HxlR family [Klenkia brasiliensis]
MATRTRAQERTEAAVAYNAFLAVCPSRQLLDRVADKWVVLVVCALGGGAGDGTPRPMRYSELSRSLAGVSQKMLTQTVRSLERDGLLTRTVTATVPVTVTYELTDLGLSLHRLTQELRVWAQDHMGTVAAHRERYDATAGPPATTGLG